MPCVLYIEDNKDNRALVRRVLIVEGFDLLEATNAEEGIAIALEQRPDLILMDINMPGMDGMTATARIKALDELRGVPVVALTANAMRGDKEKALEAGMDGYIPKPIDIDRFPQQVQRYIDGAKG
jgi:two-component system cell cycle response regulator DivK